MKIKVDFVTNSSSSSFIIQRDSISAKQMEMIKNHYVIMKSKNPNMIFEGKHSGWYIEIEDGEIKLETSMDNFDMHHFLTEIAHIDEDDIKEEY